MPLPTPHLSPLDSYFSTLTFQLSLSNSQLSTIASQLSPVNYYLSLWLISLRRFLNALLVLNFAVSKAV
ncbi:hypothetical protein AOQ84DRAFT_351774 [Glonium stellatum]|uniref:Uncharacterized protein n=1 Tax=Glonium stellatum TaxID=574774 RepID=A0A8E2FBI1_9PEZI|nr:hypothetical protein AOQ84DRAFT_351774 [Glonium stellatum]